MQPILIPPPRSDQKDILIDMRNPPPDQDPALAMLQLISLVMDRLFQIPGTQLRFGVNSLLMLVPVIGNVIPSLVSFSIVAVGLKNYRVPRVVAARMMFNSLLDASIGWIPGVGDAFDLFFKADTRNVRLLEQYMRPDNQQPPTWGHWLFLGGMALVAVAVLVLIVIGATTVAMSLFRNVHDGQ